VNGAALTRLKLSCLPPVGQALGRASKTSVAALLRQGVERTVSGT
jgi:hypothetical protein